MRKIDKLQHEQEDNGVFWLPKQGVEKLQEKLDEYNRRAEKLDLETRVNCEKTGEEAVFDGNFETYRVVEVKVSGKAPCLNGWVLAARIEHLGKKNLFHCVPGQEIPERYRESGPDCEHCGYDRERKDTFVVFNEENHEYKQVGSSCIHDFLGHSSPYALANFYRDILEVFEEPKALIADFLEPDNEDYVRPIKKVLRATLLKIEKHGWLSKSQAWEEMRMSHATASRVEKVLWPAPSEKSEANNFWKECWKREDLGEQADEIIQWAKNLESDNNYLMNLNALVEEGWVGIENLGLACSIPVAYRKAREKEQRKDSEWVGEVGERQEFDLVLDVADLKDGMYGSYTLMKFHDESGNEFVWFNSGDDSDFREGYSFKNGIEFKIKATVKDHNMFRGVKQTVIKRGKVLSE